MGFFDPASALEGVFDEWVLPNMFGGYASSTAGCINTRTYHGLLVSASLTGGNRVQLVNTLEEKVVFGGEEHWLSTHRYRDVFYPDGLSHLVGFGQEGQRLWWAFRLGSNILLKRLVFWRQNEGFEVEYSSSERFRLEVRPLLSFRTHHGTLRAGDKRFYVGEAEGSVSVKDGSLPLELRMGGVGFEKNECWYYSFFYTEEAQRGGPCVEDLYSPGTFVAEGKTLVFRAWVEPQRTVGQAETKTPLAGYLAFNPHPLIVAGYHWFWDWCRDTMVVLPTLVEETGDRTVAEKILERYFGAMVDGFLPTGFGEDGRPFYSSVDSSLWAAYAIHRICENSSSWSLAAKFLPKLEKVLDGYLGGAMFGVKLVDGLLYHDAKGATWMDAYYQGVHYTPRDGFAVEVNALWLLLLRLLRRLSDKKTAQRLTEEEERFRASFNRAFRSAFGLYDTLDQNMSPKDPREVRPNMLFALSLHKNLVDAETARRVLGTARKKLLTPYGLRTLSPDHPAYRPKYVGDRASRDAAYHNGTVWPWLVGAYCDAHLNFDPENLPYVRYSIWPLLRLAETRNYVLHEIFDADPPHSPRGCVAQAWSSAEVLRAAKMLGAR